jgi:hypothetical protein
VDLAGSRASLIPARFGADSAGLACLRAMAALGRCEWALGDNTARGLAVMHHREGGIFG